MGYKFRHQRSPSIGIESGLATLRCISTLADWRVILRETESDERLGGCHPAKLQVSVGDGHRDGLIS